MMRLHQCAARSAAWLGMAALGLAMAAATAADSAADSVAGSPAQEVRPAAAPRPAGELTRAEQFARIPPPAVRLVRCELLVEAAANVSVSADETQAVFLRPDKLPPPGARPQPRPQSQQGEPAGPAAIIEAARKLPDTQIWILDLTTRALRQITAGPGRREAPLISPKGDRLVFLQDGDFWEVATDGRNLRRLTTDPRSPRRGPAWSPDGRTLAYGAGPQGLGFLDLETKKVTLRLLPVDERPIDPQRDAWQGFDHAVSLRWTPDSRQLVFHSGRAAYLLEVATGQSHRLADTAGETLSPDGRSLVYCPREPGDDKAARLEVLALASGQVTTIKGLPDEWVMRQPVWTADGRKLLAGGVLIDLERALAGQPGALCQLRDGSLILPTAAALLRDGRIVCSGHDYRRPMMARSARVSEDEWLCEAAVYVAHLDWNAAFVSREQLEAALPAAVEHVAAAIEPKHLDKLARPVIGPPSALMRIVATSVLDDLYDRMLRLALASYPAELKTLIDNPDRYDYFDPLVDGASWGFLRRSKGLVVLDLEIIRTAGGDYELPVGAAELDRVNGYPMSMRPPAESSPRWRSWYRSEAQRISVRYDLYGPDELRRDSRQALLASLEPFFALEMFYDAEHCYDLPFDKWRDRIVAAVKARDTAAASRRAARTEPLLPANVGWPMWRRDLTNSATVAAALHVPLKEKWRRVVDGRANWAAPVVDDRHLYLCRDLTNESGAVVVLDRGTGELVRKIELAGRPESTPLVTAGRLFVTVEPRQIAAFEKGSWQQLWLSPLPGGRSEAPLMPAGGLLLRLSRWGYLAAVDPQDGRLVWKELVRSVDAGMVIVDDGRTVLYGDREANLSGALLARKTAGGELLWTHPWAAGETVAYHDTTASDGRRVFVFTTQRAGDGSGWLRALDIADGHELWSKKLLERSYGWPFVVAGGEVLVQSDRKELLALDAESGAERWKVAIPNGRGAAPIIVGGHLVGLAGANLYVVDLKSHEVVQTLRLPDPAGIFSSLISDEAGTIYVLTGDDPTVLALE